MDRIEKLRTVYHNVGQVLADPEASLASWNTVVTSLLKEASNVLDTNNLRAVIDNRDIEKIIRGMFAAYRVIKQVRKSRAKMINGQPKPSPRLPLRPSRASTTPLHFDSMDAAIQRAREQGFMR